MMAFLIRNTVWGRLGLLGGIFGGGWGFGGGEFWEKHIFGGILGGELGDGEFLGIIPYS